jgi:hypothetical protein
VASERKPMRPSMARRPLLISTTRPLALDSSDRLLGPNGRNLQAGRKC